MITAARTVIDSSGAPDCSPRSCSARANTRITTPPTAHATMIGHTPNN